MGVLRNPKHELFAQEVAKGATQDEAYERAGYNPHRANAHRLRANEKISRRIEEIQSQAAQKAGITVERIVEELIHIATADITDAVEFGEAVPREFNGELVFIQGVALKPSAELPKRVSAAISEVRKTKEGIVIKFHDKRGALEMLGKHLGMFKERVELSGQVDVVSIAQERLAKARARKAELLAARERGEDCLEP